MFKFILSSLTLLSAFQAFANPAELIVKAARMFSDVETLVAFQNRNSCSSTPDGGINRSAEWIKGRYQESSSLVVRGHEFPVPNCGFITPDTVQRNIVAVLKGGDLAHEIVLLGGHYDSRDEDNSNSITPAPGANDSGSQTALLLEVAKSLSRKSFRRTIVFVSFAGEEQGLKGSRRLVAELAQLFPASRVVSMLNFDIVGGDKIANSEESLNQFRLFVPNVEPHLSLARTLETLNARLYPDFKMLVNLRADRPGRAGDQMAFQEAGIPAVRFIETKENLLHQHTAQDLPRFITPLYMARMATLAELLTAAVAEER